MLSEAHALAITCGDHWNAAAAANLLGVTLREQGEIREAVRWHEMGLRGWQQVEDRTHVPSALNGLAWCYLADGQYQQAWETLDAAIAISGDAEINADTAWMLVGFAALAVHFDQHRTAARLLAAGDSQRHQLGLPLRPPMRLLADDLIQEVQATLGNAAFSVAWSEGGSLTVTEAVREARAVRVASPDPDDGLSRREREVLQLLVEGASDYEIAEQLFITRRTASKHVAAILEKLGAINRTAAATIAHRRGLV